MSAIIVCPDCKRKLKLPDSAAGKSTRCPACKALIPPASEPRAAADDGESSDADIPAPRRTVRAEPPERTAPARARSRPSRDEEPEDDEIPEEVEPVRKKPVRRRKPARGGSSTGLIIGLGGGGVVLLIVLAVIGAVVLRRLGNKPIPDAEWQAFTPPNSDCTVLMPGTPQPQPLTTNGITVNKYLVKRMGEQAFFAVAYMNLGAEPLQPNALEIVANAERDNMVRNLNGKVASETSITLGNLPGREFQIAPPQRGTLIERIYLAKVGGSHRVYLVVAAGDRLTPNQGDAAHFFDSFKLNAPATPPTFGDAAAPGPQQPPLANPNPNPMPPRVNPGPVPPQTNPGPAQPQANPGPRLPRPINRFRPPGRPNP